MLSGAPRARSTVRRAISGGERRSSSFGTPHKDMEITKAHGEFNYFLGWSPEHPLKTRFGGGVRVASATLMIVSFTIFGAGESLFTSRAAVFVPWLCALVPLLVVCGTAVMVRRGRLNHSDVLPGMVPTPLYWCLLGSYLCCIVQRIVGYAATGCTWSEMHGPGDDLLGSHIPAGCLQECPLNSSYRFETLPKHLQTNRTIAKSQYICFLRSGAQGSLLTVIVLICIASTSCLKIDVEATDSTVTRRYRALKEKWASMNLILNSSKIQLSALVSSAADPAWQEYIVGACLGIAASSTIAVDIHYNSKTPIAAMNFVYAGFALLSNILNGIVLYILLFWRPYNVYKRVLRTMVTLDEFLTGTNKNIGVSLRFRLLCISCCYLFFFLFWIAITLSLSLSFLRMRTIYATSQTFECDSVSIVQIWQQRHISCSRCKPAQGVDGV